MASQELLAEIEKELRVVASWLGGVRSQKVHDLADKLANDGQPVEEPKAEADPGDTAVEAPVEDLTPQDPADAPRHAAPEGDPPVDEPF